MKFRQKKKKYSQTTHALFRDNGVSIDSLEMDYKRRLSLSSSPEAQGLLSAFKLLTMVKTTKGNRYLFKNIIIADF